MKNTNTTKKKMLFFSPSLAHKGGVANYSRIILEEINLNFQVDHHVIGDKPSNSSLLQKIPYPVYDTIKLICKLFIYSYDVIHLNPSLMKYAMIRDSFYLLILDCFGYSNSTVIFFHGWDEGIIYRLNKYTVLKNLFLHYYNKVARILVLATPFKQQLTELGINEKKILVTTTLYRQSETISLGKNNNENGKIKILFMSRFVKDKGLNIACDVLKLLVDNGLRDIHFIFAGDGPEVNKLRYFIDDNNLSKFVSLPGYVTGHLKDIILAESDIFLYPTKYEGLPIVILEAMGAGQVIISTPVGGIPDVVEDGANGFLHDSDDPVVFFNSVKRLIEDKQLLNEIQKRNRIKAENNYEASIVAKKIEGIYREIIKDDR